MSRCFSGRYASALGLRVPSSVLCLVLLLLVSPGAQGGIPSPPPSEVSAPSPLKSAILEALKAHLEEKGWRCSFRAPKDQRPHDTVVSGVVVMTIHPPGFDFCERYRVGQIDGTKLVQLKFERINVDVKTGRRKPDPDSARVLDVELGGATIHPTQMGPAMVMDLQEEALFQKKDGWTDHEVVVEPREQVYARTIGPVKVNRLLPQDIEYGRYVRFGFETKEDAEYAEQLLRLITLTDGEDAVLAFRLRLQSLAKEQPALLSQILRQIYGGKATEEKQAKLVALAREGTFPMPRIEWVDSELLQGALGASSSERGITIFLSKSLVMAPEYLVAVLLEEMGHYLDSWLGGADSEGDEGLMFLVAIAKGALLSSDELDMARHQRDEGTITLQGRTLRVEFALPFAAVAGYMYLAKVAAATTLDTFLEYGIAAVTGTPPGLLTHATNLFTNMVPGLGEWRKIKKVERLLECIKVVTTTFKVLEKVPNGGKKLLKELETHRSALAKALERGDLTGAKGAWGNFIGLLREAQIASKLGARGGELVHLRQRIVNEAGDMITDIDVVTRQGEQLFYHQVKAGSRGAIRPGSDSWKVFENEIEKTLAAAAKNNARVTYYLDEASPEVLSHLKQRGIDAVLSGDFLR